MPATGRDVVVFVVGLAFAGLAPVLLLPGLEPGMVVEAAVGVSATVPLHHVGIVAVVALMAAAWVDTGRSSGTRDWE